MQKQLKAKHLIIATVVCVIASFFYVYDFIVRVMPQAMSGSLMRDLHIQAAGLGVLASLFFWGYAPMQIPCGLLFDRISARKILTVTTLFSALATLGFAYTDSFFMASFYRFVMGFMTSFAFVGALVVGAMWFRGQYFAMYTGLVQFLGCIGAIVGITPVAALTDHIGWRQASLWIAIIGFVLTALIWVFVKDAPNAAANTNSITPHPGKAYRRAFKHPQTWWVALFGFAIWAPTNIFGTTWGLSYLEEAFGLNQIVAGNYVSIVWWTIAFGGPLVGWLSKYFKSRRLPMYVCSIIGTLSAAGLLYAPFPSHLMLALWLIGIGIGSSALVIAFGLVVDTQPPEAVGTIVGFINMAVIFSGLTLLPLTGFLLQHLWMGKMANGAPIYMHHTYQIALVALPACFLLSLISTFLVKETHCEQLHEY